MQAECEVLKGATQSPGNSDLVWKGLTDASSVQGDGQELSTLRRFSNQSQAGPDRKVVRGLRGKPAMVNLGLDHFPVVRMNNPVEPRDRSTRRKRGARCANRPLAAELTHSSVVATPVVEITHHDPGAISAHPIERSNDCPHLIAAAKP